MRDESNNNDSHATAPSVINLQEIEKMLAAMVTQKLNEIQNNAVLGKQKSKSEEKKYETKHIGAENYARIKPYKKGDESFKETLKRIIDFADKYQEMTGGKKSIEQSNSNTVLRI